MQLALPAAEQPAAGSDADLADISSVLKRPDTLNALCRYWMVALDGVAVGRTMVPAIRADGAIMDTGTSLITTSSKDAAAINSVRTRLGLTLI